MSAADVLARLRELGADPVEVAPGRWVADCPCCGDRSLEIVDVEAAADGEPEARA